MAGKYGIGARVRDKDGDEGVIVGKRKGERHILYGDDLLGIDMWVPKSKLTVVGDTPAPAVQEQGGQPRFKVGDRVRCLEDCEGQFHVGGIYTVSRVYAGFLGEGRIGVELDDAGSTTNGWSADKFALAAYQPKVGDRVRVTHGHGWDGDGEVILVTDTSANVRFDSGSVGGFVFRFLQPLPIAAEAQGATDAPAGTLKIQAGRHYRTRDGRKVGPMVRREGSELEWPWEAKNYEDYCRDDGTTWTFEPMDSHRDLVAEWVDEPKAGVTAIFDELEAWMGEDSPVAVAPATATPAAPEPKFKVGDRVRVRGSSSPDIYTVATRNSFGSMSLQFPWKDGPGLEWWSDDELEPADTPVSAGAIRIGQFANLRVKVTGIDRERANVIIPGLHNPSHSVPLSALSA